MTEETTETEGTRSPSTPNDDEGTQNVRTPDDEGVQGLHTPDDEDTSTTETFPREYVEKLRTEAAEHRTRAKDRDDLAQRLHTALVAATGRLADPSDLTFDEAHLDDQDALTAALDDLLERRPHLASRRPRGDVGQGITSTSESVDLAGMLRSRAT